MDIPKTFRSIHFKTYDSPDCYSSLMINPSRGGTRLYRSLCENAALTSNRPHFTAIKNVNILWFSRKYFSFLWKPNDTHKYKCTQKGTTRDKFKSGWYTQLPLIMNCYFSIVIHDFLFWENVKSTRVKIECSEKYNMVCTRILF